MEIQLINFSGETSKFIVSEVRSFDNPKSLDMFDLNIIDLSDTRIWRNSTNDSSSYVDSISDWLILKEMIENSYSSKFLFIYPRNCYLQYGYSSYSNSFSKYVELKNIKSQIPNVLSYIHEGLKRSINYENTETKLDNNLNLEADFYFIPDTSEDNLLSSYKSEKSTCIQDDKFIYTTLKINTNDQLNTLLIQIGLLKESIVEIPEWIQYIHFFDDEERLNSIQENREKIKKLEENITLSENKLTENNKFKSILYTTGEELVEVVKNIFNQILGVDFSEFKDTKKEDLEFQFEEYTFIGEIKGVNQNIKTSNLAQLDTHFHHFIEKNSEIDPNKVRKLLIMNHQKNTPINDRTSVDEQQIRLAKAKYDILIIETIELLKMYEKFINQELATQECFKLLCNNGILKIK